MFARYFFIVVGILSLLWIGYVAADIIDKKNAYSPTSLFGEEDKQLLIINRKGEVNNSLIPFSTLPKNTEILNAILPHIHDERSIIISSQRRHFLIESKYNWSKQKVKKLFTEANFKPESTGIRSFRISGFEIDFHKNMLYVHESDLKTTLIEGWGKFDRKSSASLIDFNTGEPIIKDIYIKGQDKIEFHSMNDKKIKGNQINDQALFSAVLPRTLNSYHFREKTFAQSIDPTFQKNPMNDWIEHGYVSFIYKGQKVIISDYISGQDPINVLSDFVKKDVENDEHAHFTDIKLTEDFPANTSSGFYIYSLNDFVVMSEDQSTCEDIVTQNKLGNTLATDHAALSELYSELPSRVSERVINQKEKFSRTIYKTKILETRVTVKLTEETKGESITDKETLTMNVDANIEDFISFDGKGNAVVLTATGELMYYSSGNMIWMKNLGSKAVGKLSYIEQFQFILVTCNNSIHLLDKKGNYVLGGPINLGGKRPSQQAIQYEWRNKLYLVYPDENGNIIVYNSKGRIHSQISNSMADVSAPIDVWVSQNKLFYGIHSNSAFKMIDAERKREHRSFALPGKTQSIVNGNELFLFTNENGKLISIDQKGSKTDLNVTFGGKLLKTTSGRKDIYFINERNSELSIFSALGFPLGTIPLDFVNKEYSDVQNIDGRTCVSVIDGLENNVYLYQLDGRKLIDRSFEGGKKCMLNVMDSKLVLTTVVDNYLIQYYLNQ
jgi:hypothetical protein